MSNLNEGAKPRKTVGRRLRMIVYFRELEGLYDHAGNRRSSTCVNYHDCFKEAKSQYDDIVQQNEGSLRKACKQICTDCVGGGADTVFSQIVTCNVRKCPLHPIRLWRTPEGKSAARLAELEAKWSKIDQSKNFGSEMTDIERDCLSAAERRAL